MLLLFPKLLFLFLAQFSAAVALRLRLGLDLLWRRLLGLLNTTTRLLDLLLLLFTNCLDLTLAFSLLLLSALPGLLGFHLPLLLQRLLLALALQLLLLLLLLTSALFGLLFRFQILLLLSALPHLLSFHLPLLLQCLLLALTL